MRVTVWLLLSGLVRSARAADFQCTPPVVQLTKVEGNDTIDFFRYVAFHEKTLDNVCQHQFPPFADGRMAEYCRAFCATNGLATGLPFLLGSSRYGFNLEQMQTMCSDVTVSNVTLDEFCRGRHDALQGIEARAAQFVADVDVVKALTVAFQAEMQSNAADLRALLVSEDFRKKVDVASVPEKINVLRVEFERFKAQSVQNGSALENLTAALEHLQDSSTRLLDIVHTNLPLFQDFASKCNKLVLGIGHQEEFLLDICPQVSGDCIDSTHGAHVGCCCGFNPVVVETLTIDGLAADLFQGKGHVANQRRLQDVPGAPRSGDIHTCTQAHLMSRGPVADARESVKSLGRVELLQQKDQQLREQYQDYYNQCPSEAIVESTESRRLGEKSSDGDLPMPAPEDRTPPLDTMVADPEERALQDNVLCNPQIDAETRLKIAFSHTTEADLCYLQDPPVSAAAMQGQCEAFCGSDSVALLLGSEYYGFNQNDANSICLPPNGVLVHEPDKLRQCRSWSQAFNEIEVKTAQFIAELDVFMATRMLYVAELRRVSIELQQYIVSAVFRELMARAPDKVQAFRGEIRHRVDEFQRSTIPASLRASIERFGDRATQLESTLRANIRMVYLFLTECNELHVGTGPSEEYLLDICAQKNVACIEEQLSGHVSCCCAHHPFTTFGEALSGPTIPGITGFDFPSRVAAGTRRLEERKSSVVDICAKAWTDAAVPVSQLRECTRNTGQEEVLAEHDAAMEFTYGADYCGYKDYENASCALPSTTTRLPTTATSTSINVTTAILTTPEPPVSGSRWIAPCYALLTLILFLRL